jgi:hypothetical protein
MAYLNPALRRTLEHTIHQARAAAKRGAADALRRLGVADPRRLAHLVAAQGQLRNRLRAHARSLGDTLSSDDKQAIDHLVEQTAYVQWHRLLFARFLLELRLLRHPQDGGDLTLLDCREEASALGLPDEWAAAAHYTALLLPGVFPPDDPVEAVSLAPEHARALRQHLLSLDAAIFAADDTLGWTYQFWRSQEKAAINASGGKIGAAELPAVTQLFTEPYMVRFLLHNTLGAWWAGKVLTANPDIARGTPDENALRKACALPGVDWDYLRFVREEGGGPWRPAAGTFPGWPQRAAEITYCDPCCGSGHFLVEAFGILAALRRAEEGLAPDEAARAVLRDNLHGLEIDGRCVQIAAFNVALAAWRLAGGPVKLPVPHIAWVGAPPPLPKSEFVALANGDAELRQGLAALHDLFHEAPLLGSLIELTGGDLVDPTRIAHIEQSIAALMERMRGTEPERAEGAIAARGMADAAAILARRFTLQATNIPFLGRFRQDPTLAAHLKARFEIAKADLATAMLTRMRALAASGGTVASVTPQNWLFLGSYKKMREALLAQASLAAMGALGPRCFETISGEVVNAALVALTETRPDANTVFAGLDANDAPDPAGKAEALAESEVRVLSQADQRRNPDFRIAVQEQERGSLLSEVASAFQGIKTGDDEAFRRQFWESGARSSRWCYYQSTVEQHCNYGGCDSILWWNGDGEHLARRQGLAAFGKVGVAVSQMREMPAAFYTGAAFDSNMSPIVPHNPSHLPAIWAFCSSSDYVAAVRRIDRTLKVTNATLVKVPFDLARWQKIAAEKYPNGLPEPYSDDPTQWLFHGHPRYAETGAELHVVLARLAGYRWPAESDKEMRLSAEARARIAEVAKLPEADADGLLALVPVLGERRLAERLRTYCAAAWGDAWQPDSEAGLIAAACERAKEKPPKQPTFEAWLRSHAARQHAKLFHDRPFLWWIFDGRADGFTAVAHYHRLNHATLERLAYTMLGDWIARLGDDPRAAAARILQEKLARILEGEKPYDIFVRWKPLEKQPIGWEPDLDDGVRLNIRPFIEAGVLAYVPNVKYTVDRGKDMPSAPWYHVFNGERRNDHHTTLAEKRAAREAAAGRAA